MSDFNVTAHLGHAHTFHQAGNLAEAMRLYREVLAAEPLQADALHMLGIIAKQQGDHERALKLIEIALGQRTAMPLAWYHRAMLLRIAGRNDEALQSVEQAVSIDPACTDAWDLAGILLRDRHELERSRACHLRAVALQPDNLTYCANYALLLMATGELQQAYAMMKKVEQQEPDLLPHSMGNILKAAGYTDLALPYFTKSTAQLPDHHDVRLAAAMAHLQTGDFAEGWRLWETRPSLDARFEHVPFWNGQPAEHLLVHEDQGLGDAFMCARYIPLLRPYTKRITLQVPQALYKLFAATFPDCTVLTLDEPVPAAEGRIRMLSLPAFFKTDAATIHAPPAYLRAEKQWRRTWDNGLSVLRPRIGIVWGGNPGHLNDALRSIPFATIRPLLTSASAHIVSLQKGAQKNNVELAAVGIFDADPFLQDFTDTAGLLAELDLLISVDTSVVHLAGALGKPVWLMLPFDPDWRWMLGREDSPWYPHLRIFRQTQPRDWPGVVARVTADLHRFVAGDHSVLQPTPWNGPCLPRNPLAITL